MKLDIDRYLNRDLISDFSKHIERFDLHKIENEIIFFWQPKKGTIQDFEDSGSSFETYLETLFDKYKVDDCIGHCFLSPNLDFKDGIEYHYHLNSEEIERVNRMETGEGMFLFQGDAYVCRYDVFDVILSDKKEND